jgi:hypothetical protein
VLIHSRNKLIGIYLLASTFISAFASSNYMLGPILFFPLINICIAQGLIYATSLLRDFKR